MLKKHITFHDNFLDIELINQINMYMEEATNKNIWRSSYAWGDYVHRLTSPVALLTLPDQFSSAICKRLKKTSLTWKDDNPPSKSMYYLYPPGGYIGWHNDDTYQFASILFLNSAWNVNWGGFFLYDDLNGLGIRSEVPDFNRCVIHTGGVPHAVSIVAPDAPLRRVIVTLGPKRKPDSQEIKEWDAWKLKRYSDMKYIADRGLGELAKAAHGFVRQ